MLAGGVSETIAHFAGLMRIVEDPEPLRIILDDPAYIPPLRPWAPDPIRAAHPTPPLDPLPGDPSPLARLPTGGLIHPTGFRPHTDHVGVVPPQPGPHGPPLEPPPQPAAYGGGGGGIAILESEGPTPEQISMQIVQVNQLQNSDQLLMIAGQDGATLHTGAPTQIFDHLVDAAATVTPGDLTLQGPYASDALALVQAHDAATAAGHVDAGATPSSFGTYVDGLLQPAGSTIDFTAPTLAAAVDTSNHNGLVTPGLEAQTGQNLSLNYASIFDDHTEHSAMAVLGNSYSTDAIIQTNILVDHSMINAFGLSTLPTFLTGNDSVHNSASIQHVDLDMGGSATGSLGSQLSIDTIPGDFYNITILSQLNALNDSDAVVQSTLHTFYGVSTGHNTQINDLPVQELNGHYDLIVVEGSSHTANLIYQTNALVTDSVVLSLDMRQDGTGQTISTGNNSLANKAAITDYGASTPAQFSGDLAKSIADLKAGTLDPELAATIPDNGTGTLHVLMIQGDFYNINAISQVNLVSNIDTVAQFSPDPHTTISPTGVPMTSTQSADTGGNQLANLAQIVTVGSTSPSTFVNGAHYQTSTLIQAGFVNDASHVVTGDPHALAAQIAGMTGLPEAVLGSADDHPLVTASASAHDDLFHGVLS